MAVYIPGISKLREEVFDGGGDHVVLLHGIGHDSGDMHALGKFLSAAGYRAVAISYPSTRLPIETLGDEYLPLRLEKLVPDDGRAVHFVTHSMGGIVLRRMLATQKLPRLGRAVLIAPPNHGSPVADFLRRELLYEWYFGPAGQQLGTGADSVPLALPPADFDVGVIAGRVSLDPWFDPLLEGPHDGKIAVAATRLAGMRDFVVVPYGHTFIHRCRAVHELALNFLRSGCFLPSRSHEST